MIDKFLANLQLHLAELQARYQSSDPCLGKPGCPVRERCTSGTFPHSRSSCSPPTPPPTHPVPVSSGSQISRLQGRGIFSVSQNGIWHTAPVSLSAASFCHPMSSAFLLLKSHVLHMDYSAPQIMTVMPTRRPAPGEGATGFCELTTRFTRVPTARGCGSNSSPLA